MRSAFTRTEGLSRREILRLTPAAILTVPFALGAAAWARPLRAEAAAKSPKKAVQYQERPKDGQQCSKCRHFLPADSGPGRCKLVEGEINPQGWCTLYTPKQD